jgi:flagellar biosynthesis protein FliQ
MIERMDDMILPTPNDAKDAISQYAGFFGMVISIAIAIYLILPSGETLSNTPKLIVSILIGIFLGWLSFAIKPKK